MTRYVGGAAYDSIDDCVARAMCEEREQLGLRRKENDGINESGTSRTSRGRFVGVAGGGAARLTAIFTFIQGERATCDVKTLSRTIS
jgi:hypothetical protein